MPDYVKEISSAKQRAIDELNSHENEMSEAAYHIWATQIDEAFDTKSGKIVYDEDFVKRLNALTEDVIQAIKQTPKFVGPVSRFVRRFPEISAAISAFQKDENNISVPLYEEDKKIVIDETINQMLGNGLNQNFVQPLRNLIYQRVTSGMRLSEIKQQINDYIQGGHDASGKLGRYIDQTAQQAADSYSGVINKKLLETFKYDALLMTGSLIDTSSPQCVFVIDELNGKIRRTDWPKIEKIAVGLIPGTTFDNLPVNRFHWGCRHSFYPIILKN